MKKILPIICLVLLSACGTTSTLTSTDLSKPIPKGHARVIVERNTSMLYFGGAADIRANGAKIASLGRGGTVMRDLEAGPIVLEVSTPTAVGQYVVRFTAEPKRTYNFVVSPRGENIMGGYGMGILGDAIHANVSDQSGYFQLDLKDSAP